MMENEKTYRAKLIHSKHGWLKVGMTFFAGVALATAGSLTTQANSVHAAENSVWTARSSDQIAASVKAMQNGKYQIVWGDTLSGITAALQNAGYQTTMARIAQINQIANVDLIYAGNDLVITGTKGDAVITTQTASGQVTGHYNANPSKSVVATPQEVQQAQNQTAATKSSTANKQANSELTPSQAAQTQAKASTVISQAKTSAATVKVIQPVATTTKTTPTVTKTPDTTTTPTTGAATGGSTQITANGNQGTSQTTTSSTGTGTRTSQTPTNTTSNSAQSTTESAETAKTGTYTVTYWGKLGQVLAKETHTATIGDTLTLTTTKAFSGFLLPSQSTQTVKFTQDGQNFDFDYRIDPATAAPATSRIVIRTVDEAGNQITTDKVLKLASDSQYTATAPTVAGYILSDSTTTQAVDTRSDGVVTFHYTKRAPVEKTATVTINTLDENGKQIVAPTTKTVTLGDQVSFGAPTVTGYTLKSDATQLLTITGNQSLNFTYTKTADHTALDTAIAKAKTFSANQYTQTSFAKLTAALQTAETTDTSATATQGQLDTAADNLTTAIKALVKPTVARTITVKSVDSNGNVLATTTAATTQGSTYTATAKEISGYTLSGDQTQAVVVNGDMILTFTYTKNQVAATYQAVVKDESGKQIAAGTTVSGKLAGDRVTVKAPSIDFDKYTLANDSQTQTLVAGQNIIVFTAKTTYKQTEASKADASYQIVVNDEDGNQITKSDVVSGQHEGDKITADAPSIDTTKYTLNQSSKAVTLTAGLNTITFTATTKAIDPVKADASYSVIELDPYNAVLDYSDTVTGFHEGDQVTIVAPTIPGYQLIDGQSLTFTLKAGENDISLNYFDPHDLNFIYTDSDDDIDLDNVDNQAPSAQLLEQARQAIYTRINEIRAAAQDNTGNVLSLADGSIINSQYTSAKEALNKVGGVLQVNPQLQQAAQEHADNIAQAINAGKMTYEDFHHQWTDNENTWTSDHQYGQLINQGLNILSEDGSIMGWNGSLLVQVAGGTDGWITQDTGHNNSLLSGLATQMGVGVAPFTEDGAQYVMIIFANAGETNAIDVLIGH